MMLAVSLWLQQFDTLGTKLPTSGSDAPTMQHFYHCSQDAHEFLNYVLNQGSEILEDSIKQECKGRGQPPPAQPINTWIHQARASLYCSLSLSWAGGLTAPQHLSPSHMHDQLSLLAGGVRSLICLIVRPHWTECTWDSFWGENCKCEG